MSQILITGGAGFIGSHLADELLQHRHRVRVFDILCSQVHGADKQTPQYLNRDVELIWGDLRDRAAVDRALEGIDAVYHFAAAVGVGQSMYEVERYTSINDVGTAVLLEALIKHPVERLIVASSMSVYGEGLYRSRDGAVYSGVERTQAQLRAGAWDPVDESGTVLEPVATPESKSPNLSSVYALSKYVQERMCLMIGRAYNIPAVALRFFNVYGPRQALSNPYTGVLAIFASRYLNGKAPLIFEDGKQQRDFVNVSDVAQACRLCLEAPDAVGKVFNIGSGRAYTIGELAERMAEALGKDYLEPQITGKYRVGDIRHCFADIGQAHSVIGYMPRVTLEDGVVELVDWLEGQIASDRVDSASAELSLRGLTL
ncbi:MAG: NAD-dependent epimerase/dehydratase family protein [Deltaproteobacteria bacterium]|nr:NAD-dependent epimerase/dehydratase family protein [Deltaproteobacteria bacterium]